MRAERRSSRARGFAPLLVAVAWGIAACGAAVELSPTVGVRHLGPMAGYETVDRVSKAVLPASDGPVSVELANLPASRIHFAAARREDESARTAAATPCRVRIRRADEPDEQLAAFELPAGEPQWVEAVAASPAVGDGALHLECDGTRGEQSPVVWARPLAVPQEPSRAAPLIVLVSLDTLRADHVAGFGNAGGGSANLGALADEGLRLLDATSEGSWTLASHYSLLFSRMYGFPVDEKPLTSLAQALADGGFVTAALTGGGFMGAAFNYHLGFDHYAEYGVTNSDDLPFVLADALPAIRRFNDAPTFLFLHSFAVHQLPPNEVAWHEKHGHFQVFRPNQQQIASARTFYAEVLRKTDAELAALFDALREVRRVRPVLLVIVSDHGEAFGEHRNFRHGFGDSHVTLHDEVIRVPVIVWGPGLVPAGRSSQRPTMLSDIAPSILAAVGIAAPPSMRGTNLWPLWSGGGAGDVPPSLGSVSHTQGAWSLRTQRAKLIVEMGRRRGKKGFELYDLTSDPGEHRNLASERPAELATMRRQLRQRLSQLGVPLSANGSALPACRHCAWQDRDAFWRLALAGETAPGATVPGAVDEGTLQRLRELGYTD